jgi:hypothetical protein
MFIRASSAANIRLALENSHTLSCSCQRSRGSETRRARPHNNHVVVFPAVHDATRLRIVIKAPCVRIVNFAGVETLIRLVNTSPCAFEIFKRSL